MSDNYVLQAYIWRFCLRCPMPNFSIHPKLAHLSDSQMDNLMTRYYAGETIVDLLGEFKIDCNPHHLFKLFPPIIHSFLVCPHCDAAMMSPRISRSAHYETTMRCFQCRHEDTSRCKCDHCRNRRTTLDSGKVLRNVFDIKNASSGQTEKLSIQPDNLTLEQAVALLSLLRCPGVAYADVIAVSAAFSMATVPFAPKGNYGHTLIQKLGQAKLLSVLNSAAPDNFSVFGNELRIETPFPIFWNISRTSRTNLIHGIEQRVAQGEWPRHWPEQLPDLVRVLAFAEIKEFYDYCAKQRGLPASAPRSTSMMLNNLIQDYSVAQCYRMIYAGAKAAADFLVRASCAPQHAANYMIGACQRWVDRARAENWEVTPFHRHHELPRSMISHVLYDDFLKRGDDGFNLALDKIARPKM
ncbi:hypothetical protein [Methylomonas methanica]|uniref:Uncharacterized protein n=1 Tax=Methylomonas methanica (strain DSM 25384 / MC09) TaxID=857087 RepID=F9ZX05_METMM|nr:hypothetical protein [Methylomonas methanica]AEF98466.1 hypothetical protein Metme_0009 [Methylomonas methanica MC09]